MGKAVPNDDDEAGPARPPPAEDSESDDDYGPSPAPAAKKRKVGHAAAMLAFEPPIQLHQLEQLSEEDRGWEGTKLQG